MPTPWTYEILPARDSGRMVRITDSADNTIIEIPCWADDDIDHEDIPALIVKAVNSHEAMKETLEECLKYFEEKWPNMDFGIPEKCRQSLKLAKGE